MKNKKAQINMYIVTIIITLLLVLGIVTFSSGKLNFLNDIFRGTTGVHTSSEYLKQGQEYYIEGDYSEATKQFQKVIKNEEWYDNHTTAQVYLLLTKAANIKEESPNYKYARNEVEKLIEMSESKLYGDSFSSDLKKQIQEIGEMLQSSNINKLEHQWKCCNMHELGNQWVNIICSSTNTLDSKSNCNMRLKPLAAQD